MTNRFLHYLRLVLIGSLCFIQHCAEDDDVRVVTTITIQTPFQEVALNETTTIQLTASAFDQHKKEIHGLVYVNLIGITKMTRTIPILSCRCLELDEVYFALR